MLRDGNDRGGCGDTKGMGYPTKIATCCYCGTKAALVLGRDRHELTCSSCGAPLHDMKRFPVAADPAPKPRPAPMPYPGREAMRRGSYPDPQYRKRKKRKSVMRYLLKEAIDILEDVFD